MTGGICVPSVNRYFQLLLTIMKLHYLFAALLLASCAGKKEAQPVEETLTPSQQLMARLQNVVDSGKYIYGHADDTAYGHTWEYQSGRSDVKEVAGDYPGLINWDLGMIELDSANNLDGVPFQYMANEIRNQHTRRGINSVSWHLRNPVTGGNAWDVSDSTTVSQVVTDGTPVNKMMIEWIGKTADFIGNLKDAEGNRIPVLYRPWHEHTGGWFWWGAANCSPEDYKKLWSMTRKVFDEKGIDNVVWVYSPDKVYSDEAYIERYPGDDLIDVMGIDIYGFGAEDGIEPFRENTKSGLDIAAKAAKAHGKLLAFTETGLESLPVDNWYSEVLAPAIENYPIAFVCVWRNAWEERKPEHFYAPYPGHPSAESFVEFYNNPKTLFAKDLENY